MNKMFKAVWHVKGNPAKEKYFKLKKTAEDYQKNLELAFGDKLQYYKITEEN